MKSDTAGDLGTALAQVFESQHDQSAAVSAPEPVPPLVEVLIYKLREMPGGKAVLADLAKQLRDQGRNSAARMVEP